MFHRDRKRIEKHTEHNEQEVLASQTCGCLVCLATFNPAEVILWNDDTDVEYPEGQIDRTAICPHCSDALILGDRSGYQITNTFLETMRIR